MYPLGEGYDITFDANDCTSASELMSTFDGSLRSFSDVSNGLSDFHGWWTAPVGGEPVDTSTVFTRDCTLYAHWKIDRFTITFDTNGDTVIEPITQDYGSEITKPHDPAREGYAFVGWHMSIPDTMPGYDLTIAAIWHFNEDTMELEETEAYYDTEFCMVSFVTDHFSYWVIGEKTTMSEHKDMSVPVVVIIIAIAVLCGYVMRMKR